MFPLLCICEDSGTVLMPLKFPREGKRSYPFCKCFLVHSVTPGAVPHAVKTPEEPIQSACTMSITNLATFLCSLIPRAPGNTTVRGTLSFRQTEGSYTVLPNTVSLIYYFLISYFSDLAGSSYSQLCRCL
jgi:hypothetical protein